eukprot:gene9190-10164_t
MCLDPELSNKKTYPTFARTVAMYRQLTPTLLALFNAFNWKRVAVFIEKTSLHQDSAEFVVRKMKSKNINIAAQFFLPNPSNHQPDLHDKHELVVKMRKVKETARIVLLLTSHPIAREALLVAYNEGMINGEYLFILVMKDADEVAKKQEYSFKWAISHYAETLHTFKEVKKALDAALILAPKLPTPSYEQFQERLRKKIGGPPFFSDAYKGIINGTDLDKSESQPPLWGARAYDAVQLYAIGLNKSLQKGNDIRDGKALINQIRSVSFQSILGHDLYVDANGEVESNFTVWQKTKSGGNEPSIEMGEVGEFAPDLGSNLTHGNHLQLVAKEKILWRLTGKPPKDSPDCGFSGEKCPENPKKKNDNLFLAIAVALSVVGIVLLIIPVVMYRKHRKFISAVSCSTSNSWSIMEKEPRQKFTTVAIYKGTFVAVKKINKKSVELSRNILMELKQMRDIRHDNINMFIGACTEPGNILVVTHYAPRGSLQDVIENETIKLDKLFILSLFYDIIKGLLYLNSTEIKVHGNLKSSNCVIDSRWVLKLTDFGLHNFKARQDNSDIGTHEYFKNLLWCCPERLRDYDYFTRGTQKGDVYSLAIILQECHTREGAWSGTYLEPQEIIERVKFAEYPPFRPPVPHLIEGIEGLRDMMKKCWHEDPEERPGIIDIRKELENMMRHIGLKRNIFDNMIYMMESYTENLEELVERKTGELLEEKRKTEALLERMLPITVAKQLKKGKAVEAEDFSDVSIYFSDIVGFTSLCAECSPMQVVNILNDLYTLFDDVIKGYDVYKVETIGDAYMVASGLPIRNGRQHAKEIALMSLHIISAVKDFTIRHKPEYKLKVRIGVHTGPVVAGVVGTTMPRYCLFGDTVNTTSRMETTGEPLKIHVSASTHEVLVTLGGFHFEERGQVHLKGRGAMTTYWLVDADENLKRTKHFEEHRPLCHNAKIGSQFSMAILRNSPSLRTKLLSSGMSNTPRGTPKESPNNSPSTLHSSNRKRRKREYDSVATNDRVQLLLSNSPMVVSFKQENGEVGESMSVV